MAAKHVMGVGILVLGAVASVPLDAQDATVELLESSRTERTLYLRIGRDKHSLQYQLDGTDRDKWHGFEKDKPLSVLANRPINIWLADFNPFLQSFESSLEDFDDETFVSFGRFVEGLSSYGQAIGMIEVEKAKAVPTEAAAAPAETARQLGTLEARGARRMDPTAKATMVIESGKLDVATIVKNQIRDSPSGRDADEERVAESLVRLSEIIVQEQAGLTIAWLRLVLEEIRCLDFEEVLGFAVTLQELEAEVAKAKEFEEALPVSLTSWQEKANRGYDGLFRGRDSVLQEIRRQQKALSDHAGTMTSALGRARATHGALRWLTATTSGCGRIQTVSDTLVGPFFERTDGLVKKEQSMAGSLGKMADTLDTYSDDTRWAGSAFEIQPDIRPAFEKGRRLTVTAKSRKVTFGANGLTVEEAAKGEGTFRIRHYYPWVPEVALGAVLNDLETPKFKVAENDDGELVVMDDGTTKEEVRPALMLNWLCRCGAPALLYPGFQLGLTTGEDRPAILAGAVLRFTKPKHLAISAGALYTRYKVLGDLSVGDVVASKNDLDADLEFEGDTVFYIGAQVAFKLGKK